MKKLLQSAAVSVAMLGGGAAQAAITLDANGKVLVTPANTYEIYLSGASAVVGFIENLITNNGVVDIEQVCNPAAPIYKFQDNGNGTDQNAYYCTLNSTGSTANPQLVGLAAGKTELLIYKRSAGGSALGVAPIIADAKAPANPAAGAVEFLNISNPALCTAPPTTGALRVSTCTYSPTTAGQFQLKKPDFGVSDVDPEQFRGVANTPAGFAAVTPSDVNLLTVESAFGQAFGITATLKLRNALQEAQFGVGNACVGSNTEACMPSLTRDQVASIFVGDLDSWADLKIGASDLFAAATVKPGNARIHICTRTPGSGTGATNNINFLNYPCATAATPPKADTGVLPEAIAQTQVHAMSSAGNVDVCLRELDAGNNTIGAGFNNTYTAGALPHRWALGIQGLERNANLASDWRFIKIDGVAPTLTNVVEGKYHNWTESTFQFANNHVFDLSENLVVSELIKAASNPVVVATLNAALPHPFGAGAYLAVPNNFAPDPNGNYVNSNPVNPYSHATTTQDVNNCRVPTVYSTTVTGGIQLQ